MTLLIWTRAVSDWPTDRNYLPTGTIHLPCLRRQPLVPSVTESYPFPYAVVSSVAAVRALSRLPKLQKRLQDSEFFCFGQRTADELLANGYHRSFYPASSSAELSGYLARCLPKTSPVAVLSGQQPAFPIAESLRAEGFKISEFVIYQTITGACWPDGSAIDARQQATIASRPSIICFASPSAVEGFHKVFHRQIVSLKRNFRTVAIGKTTARQIKKSLAPLPCYVAKDFTLEHLIECALKIRIKTTDTSGD